MSVVEKIERKRKRNNAKKLKNQKTQILKKSKF